MNRPRAGRRPEATVRLELAGGCISEQQRRERRQFRGRRFEKVLTRQSVALRFAAPGSWDFKDSEDLGRQDVDPTGKAASVTERRTRPMRMTAAVQLLKQYLQFSLLAVNRFSEFEDSFVVRTHPWKDAPRCLRNAVDGASDSPFCLVEIGRRVSDGR